MRTFEVTLIVAELDPEDGHKALRHEGRIRVLTVEDGDKAVGPVLAGMATDLAHSCAEGLLGYVTASEVTLG